LFHISTSKRKKKQKRKSAAAGNAYGRTGGKGEPKNAAKGGSRRKSPPLFPLAPGHGNMENPMGLPHSHTPPHTPFFPPTFSLFDRKFCFYF